ncbi:hypothetical protein [Actinoallomurus acaciae]|uniref:Uncharacterized protein n=1 Tax=Actinoallomurus acaciae TaxID=502577 RepID=A0ABV5YKL0_9ACTN
MAHNDVRLIVVEEFIPVDNVDSMLGVTQRLLQAMSGQTATAAENLKRAMVWMAKYIAPTSEFWDWPYIEGSFDNQTRLRVNFIGLGWIVGCARRFSSHDSVDPHHVERELIDELDKVMTGVTLEATARLKSTPWTDDEIKAAKEFLLANGLSIVTATGEQSIDLGQIRLVLDDGERIVVQNGISKTIGDDTRKLLLKVKEWANRDQRFEGADWCAYKRRRLTHVLKEVDPADLPPTPEDLAFSDEQSGLYPRRDRDGYDLIAEAGGTGAAFASLVFPNYPYHAGILDPRVVVRVQAAASEDTVNDLLNYVSYLWVNHYTRIWRYLEFEDQFAYATDVRRVKELDDQDLDLFRRRALRIEELRSRIELLNRIDAGDISAFKPRHEAFVFSPGGAGSTSSAERLRTALIPSTITQLTVDPLLAAPGVLKDAGDELARSFNIFTQAASLRMQRVVQLLQALFIVAAVAQVLSLIPLAEIIEAVYANTITERSWYNGISHFRTSISWLNSIDVSLTVIRAALLVGLSFVTFKVTRQRHVRELLKRWLQ